MRTVFVGGCFDVLHVGHIRLLQRARALGHWLNVGVNTDDSVRSLKGAGRPVNTLFDRIEVLQSIRYVDRVFSFRELDQCALIRRLKPNVIVMGDEQSKRTCAEVELAKVMKIDVVFHPIEVDTSTTKILKKGG